MAPVARSDPRLVICQLGDRVLYLNPASASMVVTNQAGHKAITDYLAGVRRPDAFIQKLGGTLIFQTAEPQTGYGLVPQRLIVELTAACNLRCKTCYMSAATPRANELTTDEVTALLADAARSGVETLALIGGEPFMRDDLELLVGFATARFTNVMISTNGTMIDEGFLSTFAKEKNLTLQVSMDGPDEISNDAVRGRGSFRKASRVLDLAGERGIRTAVSSVLNGLNYNRVGEICDHAAAKGCFMTIFHKVHLFGRAREFPEILPSAAQLAHGMGVLLQKFDQYERRGKMIVDFPHNRCFRGDSTLDTAVLGCHFGRASAYITSDGSLACCSHLRDGEFLCGSVRSRSLFDIWQNSQRLDRMRRMTVEDLPSCRMCQFKYMCRGSCRADALGASGNVTGDPPDCSALRAYYDYVLSHYARTMEPIAP